MEQRLPYRSEYENVSKGCMGCSTIYLFIYLSIHPYPQGWCHIWSGKKATSTTCKSFQIKSNQMKSNQFQSNQLLNRPSHSFVPFSFLPSFHFPTETRTRDQSLFPFPSPSPPRNTVSELDRTKPKIKTNRNPAR